MDRKTIISVIGGFGLGLVVGVLIWLLACYFGFAAMEFFSLGLFLILLGALVADLNVLIIVGVLLFSAAFAVVILCQLGLWAVLICGGMGGLLGWLYRGAPEWLARLKQKYDLD